MYVCMPAHVTFFRWWIKTGFVLLASDLASRVNRLCDLILSPRFIWKVPSILWLPRLSLSYSILALFIFNYSTTQKKISSSTCPRFDHVDSFVIDNWKSQDVVLIHLLNQQIGVIRHSNARPCCGASNWSFVTRCHRINSYRDGMTDGLKRCQRRTIEPKSFLYKQRHIERLSAQQQ